MIFIFGIQVYFRDSDRQKNAFESFRWEPKEFLDEDNKKDNIGKKFYIYAKEKNISGSNRFLYVNLKRFMYLLVTLFIVFLVDAGYILAKLSTSGFHLFLIQVGVALFKSIYIHGILPMIVKYKDILELRPSQATSFIAIVGILGTTTMDILSTIVTDQRCVKDVIQPPPDIELSLGYYSMYTYIFMYVIYTSCKYILYI